MEMDEKKIIKILEDSHLKAYNKHLKPQFDQLEQQIEEAKTDILSNVNAVDLEKWRPKVLQMEKDLKTLKKAIETFKVSKDH